MTASDPGCGGHAALTAELRALATAALDKLEPMLERLRSEPATAAATSTCAACPLCAVLAAVRGERPELAVRLAEQAAGLMVVLRAALEEGDPAAWRPSGPAAQPADADSAPAAGGRIVQRIPVVRVGTPR